MTACITQFFREARAEGLCFLQFCKKEKCLRWLIAFAILLFWGIKITNNDIFIDSEILSVDPNGLFQSWYGIKRYGLIVTKKLIDYVRLVPYLSNLLFVASLWGITLFFCFCMKRWFFSDTGAGGRWGLYLTAVLFVSCPSLAEQYVYTLQAFEITVAMGFCMIAAYCTDQAISERKSLLWCCPALFFLVWSLGSYQGLCSFYIAMALLFFLGSYERRENQKPFRAGLCHAAVFILGFVLNTIVGNAICLLKGGDPSYVEGMFVWGRIPFAQSVQYIWDEFRILFCGLAPALYNRAAGMVFFLAAGGLFIRSISKKWNWQQTLCYWLALLLLAASPMFVSLLTGTRTPVRAQLAFPLVFTFFAVILWDGIRRLFLRLFGGRRRVCRVFCTVLTLYFLAQTWNQGISLIQLNQTVHDTFTHDVLTAQRMYIDICHAADRDDMQNQPVVFIGARDARMPQSAVRGEAIGHSFFDFGITAIGVSNRAISLFNYLGMNIGSPTPEDYQAALEAARDRPCWPARDSIFDLDGCLVVKLSD